MSDVITTKSGARVKIAQDPDTGLWVAVRDDGLLIYRARSHTEVTEYVRKFGDVLQSAVPGKALIF